MVALIRFRGSCGRPRLLWFGHAVVGELCLCSAAASGMAQPGKKRRLVGQSEGRGCSMLFAFDLWVFIRRASAMVAAVHGGGGCHVQLGQRLQPQAVQSLLRVWCILQLTTHKVTAYHRRTDSRRKIPGGLPNS